MNNYNPVFIVDITIWISDNVVVQNWLSSVLCFPDSL